MVYISDYEHPYDDESCPFCGEDTQEQYQEALDAGNAPDYLEDGFCSEDHQAKFVAGEVFVDGLTVKSFCDHIGVDDCLSRTLRAIDKHNVESISVFIHNRWIGPDDDCKDVTGESIITQAKVTGTAWDDSDWEWGETIDVTHKTKWSDIDGLRVAFGDALEEWNAMSELED